MKAIRYATVAIAAVFPVITLVMANGCGNKKESDAPATSAAPPPPPTASAPATVAPEEPDAGADASDASDADAAKPTGPGGGSYASISKCCAALRQNANSAPPEQKGGYLMAAQTCEGLKNTPVAQQAFSQLRMFLMGAKMPASCQ